MDSIPGKTLATGHLLTTLGQFWPPLAPDLLLSTPSPALLADLLDLSPKALGKIVVPSALLNDPAITQRVMRAQQRGLPLVWHGEPGQQLMPAFASCFTQHIASLTPEQALAALRASRRRPPGAKGTPSLPSSSPVRANQMYDGIASQALAAHCLDEQGAAALLGWPMDDVLYSYRQARIQPGQQAIRDLIKSINADASMDDIERRLGQDPILVYRFLRYTNSAGLGLRQEIDALRQGLMVLGLARTKSWLQELLPHATQDPNLQPVRQAMVLRARFMAELLETGDSDALKRELYLCGLLSQIDLLVSEHMTGALHGVSLPGRVKDALLAQNGPYWPYLDLATAIETPQLALTRERCGQHGFDLEDVNLALLRTLVAPK